MIVFLYLRVGQRSTGLQLYACKHSVKPMRELCPTKLAYKCRHAELSVAPTLACQDSMVMVQGTTRVPGKTGSIIAADANANDALQTSCVNTASSVDVGDFSKLATGSYNVKCTVKDMQGLTGTCTLSVKVISGARCIAATSLQRSLLPAAQSMHLSFSCSEFGQATTPGSCLCFSTAVLEQAGLELDIQTTAQFVKASAVVKHMLCQPALPLQSLLGAKERLA